MAVLLVQKLSTSILLGSKHFNHSVVVVPDFTNFLFVNGTNSQGIKPILVHGVPKERLDSFQCTKKHLSASAVETGVVSAICSVLYTSENDSSNECCMKKLKSSLTEGISLNVSLWYITESSFFNFSWDIMGLSFEANFSTESAGKFSRNLINFFGLIISK